ncbi:uncharacterized protein LACBIDRAFT_322479 [Laccaria bicolor S238N-H82]|uniref:Predicted protein n=1 Tax=Laccaria bicolor (strain S238N-H82 / ATCC MYA-4686) TaxID=486041 RepID=B0CWF8_LACBS|nr:uncharacterized protein LACBIDRAFT_322479 [Laccaria bicolor S238N-H82]EDR13060.1 predicted protein [Laccaria bicolor S238N-H82]|eukprot:XP_001875558.1 predicted protein [Laccaria bicolor S238N-H82]
MGLLAPVVVVVDVSSPGCVVVLLRRVDICGTLARGGGGGGGRERDGHADVTMPQKANMTSNFAFLVVIDIHNPVESSGLDWTGLDLSPVDWALCKPIWPSNWATGIHWTPLDSTWITWGMRTGAHCFMWTSCNGHQLIVKNSLETQPGTIRILAAFVSQKSVFVLCDFCGFAHMHVKSRNRLWTQEDFKVGTEHQHTPEAHRIQNLAEVDSDLNTTLCEVFQGTLTVWRFLKNYTSSFKGEPSRSKTCHCTDSILQTTLAIQTDLTKPNYKTMVGSDQFCELVLNQILEPTVDHNGGHPAKRHQNGPGRPRNYKPTYKSKKNSVPHIKTWIIVSDEPGCVLSDGDDDDYYNPGDADQYGDAKAALETSWRWSLPNYVMEDLSTRGVVARLKQALQQDVAGASLLDYLPFITESPEVQALIDLERESREMVNKDQHLGEKPVLMIQRAKAKAILDKGEALMDANIAPFLQQTQIHINKVTAYTSLCIIYLFSMDHKQCLFGEHAHQTWPLSSSTTTTMLVTAANATPSPSPIATTANIAPRSPMATTTTNINHNTLQQQRGDATSRNNECCNPRKHPTPTKTTPPDTKRHPTGTKRRSPPMYTASAHENHTPPTKTSHHPPKNMSAHRKTRAAHRKTCTAHTTYDGTTPPTKTTTSTPTPPTTTPPTATSAHDDGDDNVKNNATTRTHNENANTRRGGDNEMRHNDGMPTRDDDGRVIHFKYIPTLSLLYPLPLR